MDNLWNVTCTHTFTLPPPVRHKLTLHVINFQSTVFSICVQRGENYFKLEQSQQFWTLETLCFSLLASKKEKVPKIFLPLFISPWPFLRSGQETLKLKGCLATCWRAAVSVSKYNHAHTNTNTSVSRYLSSRYMSEICVHCTLYKYTVCIGKLKSGRRPFGPFLDLLLLQLGVQGNIILTVSTSNQTGPVTLSQYLQLISQYIKPVT